MAIEMTKVCDICGKNVHILSDSAKLISPTKTDYTFSDICTTCYPKVIEALTELKQNINGNI